ncbi:ABC transporter substrate-binding protein [Pediococcus parvulus]|uniref:ABC transporter substrate-binding protein n=1 Tax=Pediococcus parvulus TaxID=54062 RepID=UPI00345EE613
MKNLRRTFLSVIFALTLVLTLSACTTKEASTSASHRVTITFWHGMTGVHKTALNKLISKFNHSQTKYKVVGSSQGDFTSLQQKITAAAKSKTLPTISQATYTEVPGFVQGGFVTSFDSYIKKSDLSDLYPAFVQSSKYQGKYYSMPFSKSVRVLVYNKDLLKKYGLSVPKTWTDIEKDGIKLKSKGITAIAFDQTFMSELDDLAKQGGTPLVSNKLKAGINTTQTLAATHIIWDMLQNKTATTAGTDGYGSVQFFAGKTLFYSGSFAGISIMTASTPKGLHWGTAPLPSYKGKRATSLAGNDIVMFKSASNAQRKGAAAFVKFLMSKKQTINWAEQTGYVPLTKSAQTDPEYKRYLAKSPTAKAAAQSLSFGYLDPAFLGYDQYLVDLEKATSEITANHVTPEKAMGQLQKQTEKILKTK